MAITLKNIKEVLAHIALQHSGYYQDEKSYPDEWVAAFLKKDKDLFKCLLERQKQIRQPADSMIKHIHAILNAIYHYEHPNDDVQMNQIKLADILRESLKALQSAVPFDASEGSKKVVNPDLYKWLYQQRLNGGRDLPLLMKSEQEAYSGDELKAAIEQAIIEKAQQVDKSQLSSSLNRGVISDAIISALEAKITDLTQRVIPRLIAKIGKLEEENVQLEAAITSIVHENDTLVEQVDVLGEDKKYLQEHIKCLQETVKELETKVEKQKGKKRTYKESFKKLVLCTQVKYASVSDYHSSSDDEESGDDFDSDSSTLSSEGDRKSTASDTDVESDVSDDSDDDSGNESDWRSPASPGSLTAAGRFGSSVLTESTPTASPAPESGHGSTPN